MIEMDDSMQPEQLPAVGSTEEFQDSPKIVHTRELFAGAREICIDHEGELYVLRITRRGKLILQK
jgi:hemin uptake protein HemP